MSVSLFPTNVAPLNSAQKERQQASPDGETSRLRNAVNVAFVFVKIFAMYLCT